MPAENVYGSFRPVDIAGSIQDGYMAGQQAKMNNRKMAEEDRQREEGMKLRDLYRKHTGEDGKLDRAGYISDMAKLNPEKAMEWQDRFRKQDSEELEHQGKLMDDKINRLGVVANLAGSARDQASYESALARAGEMGLDVSQMPKQFDPGLMRTYAYNSMKMAERLSAQKQEFDQRHAADRLAFERSKENADTNLKREELAQRDRHKQADLASNADLVTKQGQQRLNQLYAQAEQDRITKGMVSGDTQAKLDAQLKGPKTDKFNKDQNDAGGYARRLQQAEDAFGGLAADGFDRTSVGAGLQSMLPSTFQSDNLQAQEQAERNFINANLRRESGAAISPSEFDSAAKQYFPRQGDSEKVLAQKAANRAQVIENMRAASGGAIDRIPLIAAREGIAGKNGGRGGGSLIKDANAGKQWDSVETNPQYFQAMKWIQANPDDPRAKAMLQKIKGE